MNKKAWLIVAAITFLGLVIRGFALTSSPPGLYIDETSIGYNAYSIVTTGKDEHDKAWPMFFEAFGEWKLPVYIYSVVFTQYIFGPTDASVRIPAVVYGTLTIPLLYLLSKELLDRQKSKLGELVPFSAAFLLSISPWHFLFTHAGFEASTGLFFFILALYLFLKAARIKSSWLLVWSIVAFVLTLYSYNSCRIVTPIVLGYLIITNLKNFRLKTWVVVIGIGAVLAWPFIKFASSPAGLVRAGQMVIWYQPAFQENWLTVVFKKYLSNISPFYIFYWGDPTIADTTAHRMSLHYLVEAPFFFLGLVTILKKRTKKLFLPIVIFLVSLIPPAITTSQPHALRGFLVLGGSIFISSLGTGVLLSLLKHRSIKILAIVTYVVVLVISSLKFLNIYHTKYVPSAYLDWQVHHTVTGSAVHEIERYYDEIYIGDGMGGVSMLWNLRIDPRLYLASENNTTVGKYHFGIVPTQIDLQKKILYVTAQEIPGKLVQEVNLPNGRKVYNLWEL